MDYIHPLPDISVIYWAGPIATAKRINTTGFSIAEIKVFIDMGTRRTVEGL